MTTPCSSAVSLYVESIPNRSSPPAILLRESRQKDGKVKRRTLANLSKLPPHVVEAIRQVLKGAQVMTDPEQAFVLHRSLPHGHVCAVLGLCRKLGLRALLHRHKSRPRELALAALVARLLSPASKLATARQLSPATATSSLGAVLGLGKVSHHELLAMLDWLCRRQPWIEQSLAHRHLSGKTLILYDLTSSYVEGRHCPLAAFGYNRDGKKGKMQITFGLLCAAQGCPVAVEVFSGNTSDPKTVASQVRRIRKRFGIERIALVGDRGMLTTARIREDLVPAQLDWVSALRTADLRKLLVPGLGEAPLCPERLSGNQVAEILSPDFPGERLLVCLNPRLREERARKRAALLEATEARLEKIARSVHRAGSRRRGAADLHQRVGRDLSRYKMGKHFDVTVAEASLRWVRNEASIAAEARFDGIYVVRTSLPSEALGSNEAVEAYKSLAQVERAFRSIRQGQLEVRPLHVRTENHVRGHVFLCMLAYYVEWHLRRQLAPMLFQDDDPQAARAQRQTPVQKATRSPGAIRKALTLQTETGHPAHSLRTLLEDLATLTWNEASMPDQPEAVFPLLTQPTPLQEEVFQRLDIDHRKVVPVQTQA